MPSIILLHSQGAGRNTSGPACSMPFLSRDGLDRCPKSNCHETMRSCGGTRSSDTEIALLKEETGDQGRSLGSIPVSTAPHFTPIQRMRILQVKAAEAGRASRRPKHS